jgi:hypothetical protein
MMWKKARAAAAEGPPPMRIDQAFTEKRLFGAGFYDIATWQIWLTILCAAFALPLDAQQLQTFATISGGRLPPTKRVSELWVLAGRRGGQSRIAALIALYIALYVPHRISPGEKPMVLVIAGTVDQATIVFDFVRGFLQVSEALRKEVKKIRQHEIQSICATAS